MTSAQTPAPVPGAAPVEKIRQALIGYRVMAWTTGVWLIALCYEVYTLVPYYLGRLWPESFDAIDKPPTWIGVVHGWVYFIYLLATLNLATKVRWAIGKTLKILLAGTIPLLGIIVEHFQTRDIKAQFGL